MHLIGNGRLCQVNSIVTAQYGITAEYVTLWGTGSPRREFLFVDDLAEACVLLMERHNADEIGEIINVGSGKDIALCDLASIIQKIVGFPGDIKWDTTKPDGMPQKLLDVSRIRELGWHPKVHLEDGIAQSYRWYIQQKI
jgi:GDP-L-fucose synthase